MLVINEIFLSIQGESTYAGCPCVFVRLTACDLRCSWCDTAYTYENGRELTVDAVMLDVARYGCRLVEITGGEPLLQEDVYTLMQRLIDAGHTVLLETGGHVDVSGVPAAVIKIVDIKCPASGEAASTAWSNLEYLTDRDQVKFVVSDRSDYEYARGIVTGRRLDALVAAILFSPVHGVLDPGTLASWVLTDRLPVRVQLQIHKYIWGAAASGV